MPDISICSYFFVPKNEDEEEYTTIKCVQHQFIKGPRLDVGYDQTIIEIPVGSALIMEDGKGFYVRSTDYKTEYKNRFFSIDDVEYKQ